MPQHNLNLEKVVPAPSLTEMALSSIKEAILSKKLDPGKMYTEAALTKELGISRTPVREALIQLASRGLIIYFPRKGFQIKSLTETDVENLFELRRALECSVIEHITPVLNDESLAAIERNLFLYEQVVQQDDPLASIHANRDFHGGLANLTNNYYLIKALDQIGDLTDLASIRSLEENSRSLEAALEHRNILRALKEKSVDEALRQMDAHIRTTKQRVLTRIRKLETTQ